MSPDRGHRIELVRLSVPTMEALVAGDLPSASRSAGAALSPYLVEEGWPWRIRLEQVAEDPPSLDWVARAAVDAASGQVVGHVGFHGPPDEHGMVEVAYSGDWVVRTVRASVAPDNEASMATLRTLHFAHIGEQGDEKDGQELVFERPVRAQR